MHIFSNGVHGRFGTKRAQSFMFLVVCYAKVFGKIERGRADALPTQLDLRSANEKQRRISRTEMQAMGGSILEPSLGVTMAFE
jgi:hypothetical protein